MRASTMSISRRNCARSSNSRPAVSRCAACASPRWVIDEREAEIVQLIFRLFTDPGHRWGIRRITACLNRDGYRRRSGLLWHPDKVRGIVNNPAVAGHLFYDEAAFSANVPSRAPKHRQVLSPASHEPITTLDVCREAQRIKTENTPAK